MDQQEQQQTIGGETVTFGRLQVAVAPPGLMVQGCAFPDFDDESDSEEEEQHEQVEIELEENTGKK